MVIIQQCLGTEHVDKYVFNATVSCCILLSEGLKDKWSELMLNTEIMTKEDLYGKEYSRDGFVFFWKNDSRYSDLSQWYAVSFVIDGIRYNCAEVNVP